MDEMNHSRGASFNDTTNDRVELFTHSQVKLRRAA